MKKAKINESVEEIAFCLAIGRLILNLYSAQKIMGHKYLSSVFDYAHRDVSKDPLFLASYDFLKKIFDQERLGRRKRHENN